MTRALLIVFVALFAAGILAARQQPPDDRNPWGREMAQGPPPPLRPSRPPMERAFHGGPPGRWWMDPSLVQRLGLTADQQKRIDTLFQQNRLKLIDLSAGLQKEEAILEPLLEADRPDELQVLAQIDRIAQARAGLEKANARMLLGFRGVLTLDQWKKLQAEEPPRRGQHP
jgi:protein CpxP